MSHMQSRYDNGEKSTRQPMVSAFDVHPTKVKSHQFVLVVFLLYHHVTIKDFVLLAYFWAYEMPNCTAAGNARTASEYSCAVVFLSARCNEQPSFTKSNANWWPRPHCGNRRLGDCSPKVPSWPSRT